MAGSNHGRINHGETAKSQIFSSIVIPAKAGILFFQLFMDAGSKPAPELTRGPA